MAKKTAYGYPIVCQAKECDRNLPSKSRFRGEKKCLDCRFARLSTSHGLIAYTSMNIVRYRLYNKKQLEENK
jgi:hypothetical protein